MLSVIPPTDLTALLLFCVLWLGHRPAVTLLGDNAINAGLHGVRALWMHSMARRDNRIGDSNLIGHVVHSTSFFASTSLIAIGALLSLLLGLDRLQAALDTLALGVPAGRGLLELKVLLPIAVLVHGLFKLTWALRQLNYTIALMGAMPPGPVAEPLAGELASAIGGVLSSALTTFNDGIRSYYFAIAALGWLAGPVVLAGFAIGLMALLLWRQFRSGVAGRFRVARMLVEQAHRSSQPAADEAKTKA